MLLSLNPTAMAAVVTLVLPSYQCPRNNVSHTEKSIATQSLYITGQAGAPFTLPKHTKKEKKPLLVKVIGTKINVKNMLQNITTIDHFLSLHQTK